MGTVRKYRAVKTMPFFITKSRRLVRIIPNDEESKYSKFMKQAIIL